MVISAIGLFVTLPGPVPVVWFAWCVVCRLVLLHHAMLHFCSMAVTRVCVVYDHRVNVNTSIAMYRPHRVGSVCSDVPWYHFAQSTSLPRKPALQHALGCQWLTHCQCDLPLQLPTAWDSTACGLGSGNAGCVVGLRVDCSTTQPLFWGCVRILVPSSCPAAHCWPLFSGCCTVGLLPAASSLAGASGRKTQCA